MDRRPTPAPPSTITQRPRLTITAGPPSSGKSEWAASTRADRLGFNKRFISRDSIRANIAGPDYLDAPLRPEIEEAVTLRIRHLANEALQDGHDVVIDGCNTHPVSRRDWKKFATANDAAFRVVIFTPAFEQVQAANAERRAPTPEADLREAYERWQERLQTFSPLDPDNQFI